MAAMASPELWGLAGAFFWLGKPAARQRLFSSRESFPAGTE
jgi:hypothetical protein